LRKLAGAPATTPSKIAQAALTRAASRAASAFDTGLPSCFVAFSMAPKSVVAPPRTRSLTRTSTESAGKAIRARFATAA